VKQEVIDFPKGWAARVDRQTDRQRRLGSFHECEARARRFVKEVVGELKSGTDPGNP
jgi:hypothetical protein